MSHDGLAKEVYTNMKALYNGIIKTGYNPTTVTIMEISKEGRTFTDVAFNYKNLCKALKNSSRNGQVYEHAEIGCEGDSCINVEEHQIVSKND
jgi:hypothetical protein